MKYKSRSVFLLFAIISINTFSQTVPDYVPTNGLVAWYPFTGNAIDSSGNGNDGTVNGATLTSDRYCNLNSAYSFNGVTDYIKGLCDAFPTASRTVSIWFNSSNVGITPKRKCTFGYGGGICGTSWIQSITVDNLGCGGHCAGFGTESYPNFHNNSWHHWVITNDSISGTIHYFDGQQINSNDPVFVNNTNVSGKEFYIGAIPGPGGTGLWTDANVEPFSGKLDDVAIYNRALTAFEIQQLYNGYAPAITSQPSGVNLSIGDSAQFRVSTMEPGATYQWQTDSAGSGFGNIVNGGQYIGTANDTLWVNAVTSGNNNQRFRCVVSSPGFCTDTSHSALLIVKVQYIFTGSGNWDISTNWISNTIPPAALPANAEILINPAGNSECVLNVAQTILANAKITVMAGKKLRITGDLTINQ